MFRVFILLPAVLLGALSLPGPAQAQTQRDPRQQMEYLQSIGRAEEAIAIRDRLFDALERDPLAVDPTRRPALAQFFCYVMAANGLTAEMVDDLQDWTDPEIDLVRAITSDNRPMVEQSLFADLVVLAQVVGMEDVDGPDNRRRSDITFRIRRRLLGTSPGDRVTIHQRSTLAEAAQPGSREISPRKGEQYLLLLSRGLYGFGRYRRGEVVDEDLLQGSEAMVYRFYRYVDDRLVWSGYDEDDTERAFAQVEKLAVLRRAKP